MSSFSDPAESARPRLRVVQCWDDGVSDDIRLCEILRRYGAMASFNLCAGTHRDQRFCGWRYRDEHEVWRLSWDELPAVYEGFTIANHSLTHPHPRALLAQAWQREVKDNRKRLQDHFGEPVYGFAYPFGDHDASTMDGVRAAGHRYARTVQNATPCFPPEDPMAFHPDCHFLAGDFWDRYDRAKDTCEVFYFWGHSYELTEEAMWTEFESKIARISADSDAAWAELPELFAPSGDGN